MKYEETILIYYEDFDLYNDLLNKVDFDDESEDMQEVVNKLNAKQDDELFIGGVEFENGYYMSCSLCSGMSNYYENFVLFDENGNEVWCNEVDYTLDDIKVEIGNDTYCVRFLQYD